jgi:hypothetical protein
MPHYTANHYSAGTSHSRAQGHFALDGAREDR